MAAGATQPLRGAAGPNLQAHPRLLPGRSLATTPLPSSNAAARKPFIFVAHVHPSTVTIRSYLNFIGYPWRPSLRASAPPVFIPKTAASTPGGSFPVGLLGDPARGARLHRLNCVLSSAAAFALALAGAGADAMEACLPRLAATLLQWPAPASGCGWVGLLVVECHCHCLE
ncbi:hypothetical protein TRIUR3_24107 [Triticum urartu]|uniref:Uncharacterized protein n=1 Tax=Triticum urartu TaxID=4572 RepID=M7ZZY5_TRIUA|nr:hypothetical protein TRIUR3_24107 [Triticum urartu]